MSSIDARPSDPEKAALGPDAVLPTSVPNAGPKATNNKIASRASKLALIGLLAYLAYQSLVPGLSGSKSSGHGSDVQGYDYEQHASANLDGEDAYFAALAQKGWKISSPVKESELNEVDMSIVERETRKHGRSRKVDQNDSDSDSDSDSDDDEDASFNFKKDKKDKKHKHKYHHHKHPKHPKHPEHPHPPLSPHHPHPPHRVPKIPHHPPFKWIGPKEAEEIFLTVPNNESCRDASRRYTGQAHMAGTGKDLLSALYLKAEYETYLDLPRTSPSESVYPAGSPENQASIREIHLRDTPIVFVDTYYPMMNKPVYRIVHILTPGGEGLVEWSAAFREDIVKGDPTSIYRDEVPTFHGLSVSGDVTGRIFFAGYGLKEDFEKLEKAGVEMKGNIALVKYGKNLRGLKVKAAQEAGAIGCLIMTDPGDDGEITEENGYAAYPDGPARQPSSVERGSVQFISMYPGDPTTPNVPAYENVTRVPAANQPSIPSLPISYVDAIPLLETLVGYGQKAKDIGAGWEGGLTKKVEYWTGPGEKDVHFVNEVDTKVTPVWSVFAVIPGHIKDEVVVIGNHRDAWVLGAADPSSGTATLNEIMRGFQVLRQKGWKPLRTIVVASWDAEEYGLISSTEWVEDFGDWIKGNVVAYLNLDVSVAGTNFHGSASPSLAHLIKDAAQQIEHPTDATRSLWDMKDGGDWAEFNAQSNGLKAEEDYELLFASSTGISPLGSGSDFTGFLAYLGVACTDMGYGGGPKDPPYHYHSIYDSQTWQEKYGDPGFHKHTAAAQVLGLMILRVADGLVLPLNVSQYSQDMSGYLAKVQLIAEKEDIEIDFTALEGAIINVQTASISLAQSADAALAKLKGLLPKLPVGKKEKKHCLKSYFNRGLKAMGLKKKSPCHAKIQAPRSDSAESSSAMVKRTRVHHSGEINERLAHGGHHGPRHESIHTAQGGFPELPSPEKIREIKKVLLEIRSINKRLAQFESGFISEAGIKDREWYKHKGTAPGKWLGYGATTFPALTEALNIDHDAALAQLEADELAEMINRMAVRLLA